jgi:aminoglycoside N3'-acetyltransferase
MLYSINSWIKKKLPVTFYKKIRKGYFYLLKKRQRKFSKDGLKAFLKEELDLQEGVDVFVHSSKNQVNLDFPFSEVLPLLLEIVGKEGTVLFPCWENIKNFEDYSKNSIFDVNTTKGDMGVLPELARGRKDAFRSIHPINSIVAIGKNAEWYTSGHHQDIYPAGFKSPLHKLKERNGLVIGIGVSTRYLTFVHCVEDTMPGIFPSPTRKSEPLTFKVRNSSGELMEVASLVPHQAIAIRDVPRFMKKNISRDIARDVRNGGTNFFTVHTKELAERMQELAKKNITIYHFK